jgi:hypothetical protein
MYKYVQRMKEATLKSYMQKLMTRDSLKDFIDGNSSKGLDVPVIYVVPSCGPLVAGQTFGKRLVEISSWVLVDDEATEAVLRHELAHAVKVHCNLQGTAHGAGFIASLKGVSPRKWRTDKYWWPTPAIEEARLKIHTKSKSILNIMR